MIGAIIALILWYLSGGFEMFLNDLPSVADVFKMPLLIPDANYYTNEVKIDYTDEDNNVFLVNDAYGLHDYGMDEEYFLNNQVYDNEIYDNEIYEKDIYINEDNIDVEKIYEDDTLKAIEESIKDLY